VEKKTLKKIKDFNAKITYILAEALAKIRKEDFREIKAVCKLRLESFLSTLRHQYYVFRCIRSLC